MAEVLRFSPWSLMLFGATPVVLQSPLQGVLLTGMRSCTLQNEDMLYLQALPARTGILFLTVRFIFLRIP
jgi:hypothetical protein